MAICVGNCKPKTFCQSLDRGPAIWSMAQTAPWFRSSAEASAEAPWLVSPFLLYVAENRSLMHGVGFI